MKKKLLILTLAIFLSMANIPITAQAATRAEMMQQIESLTKLISLLQAQLKASKETRPNSAQTNYYIESGEVLQDTRAKFAMATLMFGMGDYLIVETRYSDENTILDAILAAVRKVRPTAQYVSKANIKIKDVHVVPSRTQDSDSVALTLVPADGVLKVLAPEDSSHFKKSQEELKFQWDLMQCVEGKSYNKEFGPDGGFITKETFAVAGKSNGKCKINYTHTLTDRITSKNALRINGYCKFDSKISSPFDVGGDPIEVSSMLPYIISLHKKDDPDRSAAEQYLYNSFTEGDFAEFMKRVEEANFGLTCKVKSIS